MLPDFDGWAMFAAVAHSGSFREGAAATGVSVPTVSKAIARLERRLGIALFHRTSRRVTLTQSGSALVGHASDIVRMGRAAEEIARADADTLSGVIRITAPMTLGLACLGDILADFSAVHPGITMDIVLTDAQCDLVAEGIDLALRVAELADSSLISQRIVGVAIGLLASPDYCDAHGTPQHPDELSHHRLCGYGHASRDAPIQLTGPDGIHSIVKPSGPLFANNGELMLPMLLSGQAIGVLPDFIAHDALMRGALVRLLPGWTLGSPALHLISPPSRLRPARVQALASFLVDRLRDHPLLHPAI